MKKTWLFALLLASKTAVCQPWIPIVTPLNEWVVDYKHPVPGWPSEKIRLYTFSADSVLLGGKYYHDLLYSVNMSGGPWTSSELFLREENGRVYVKSADLPEKLLYDFHLGTGDSITGTPNVNQATRYVTQVGTVPLLDGIPRKSITLASPCGESQWVEGIGEMGALFDSETFCSLWDGNPLDIRCFRINGLLLYQRPDISSCYTSAVNNPETAAIRVYPNPGSDILYFDIGTEETIHNVQIYNSLGQRVLSTHHLRSADNSLDISILPPGFYIGWVHLDGQPSKSFQWLVKR